MAGVDLAATARALVPPGKGILAADESFDTIERRFQRIGVLSSAFSRAAYRELLFTTPGMARFISGVILFDETIRHQASDGREMPRVLDDAGVIPGIKVDTGAKPLAGAEGETVTEGLDGLRDRLGEYCGLGARFAKWRAVIRIGEGRPTRYAIEVNAHALGRYAALCQEAGLVPIVEPEVLMDGSHSIELCAQVTRAVLETVFHELHRQRVDLAGTLLKPNMVVSGVECSRQAGVDEVAEATLECLRAVVPPAVPGIVFLSGGQSDEAATAHLDAMNRRGPQPWQLSFSFGRALQSAALEAWGGDAANVETAQQAFLHRARCNGAARAGEYSAVVEHERVALG